MKKVVNKTINHFVKNVDTYNNAGSTWLIFTETKQWVIELTREKTLWYNYNFFKNVFNYVGLDVVENQHYITQWVEETIINKVKRIDNSNYSLSSSVKDVIENGVKDTSRIDSRPVSKVEDTIQNGVKETNSTNFATVEDTIENGVKHTNGTYVDDLPFLVKDVIENGVKETHSGRDVVDKFIIDTLENGVKLTNKSLQTDGSCVIEDTIQNGVKETLHYDHHCLREVVGTIQNGVKHTMRMGYGMEKSVEDTIQNGIKEVTGGKTERLTMVNDTIQNGVKKTKRSYDSSRRRRTKDTIQNGIKETKTPGADGDIESTLEWIKENDYKYPPNLIDDVIDNGVKYTGGIGNPNWMGNKVEKAIENGIKETVSSIYPIERVVERVIEVGVLETKPMDEWVNTNHIVNRVMVNGIKEVQPLPAQDGNRDWGVYYYRKGEPTKPHTKYVDEVIENGIKEY